MTVHLLRSVTPFTEIVVAFWRSSFVSSLKSSSYRWDLYVHRSMRVALITFIMIKTSGLCYYQAHDRDRDHDKSWRVVMGSYPNVLLQWYVESVAFPFTSMHSLKNRDCHHETVITVVLFQSKLRLYPSIHKYVESIYHSDIVYLTALNLQSELPIDCVTWFFFIT